MIILIFVGIICAAQWRAVPPLNRSLERLASAFATVMLGIAAYSGQAIAEIRWEPAFPRPHGIVLIDEINEEKLAYYIDNKEKVVTIAGRYNGFRFATDLSYASIYATEMFDKGLLNRDGTYKCKVATSKDDLKRISRLEKGSQLILEGRLVEFGDGVFEFEDCSMRTDVNLFHPSDLSIILGSWCHAYKDVTYSVTTFSRGEKGLFKETTLYENGWTRENDVRITSRRGALQITVVTPGYREYSHYRTVIDPFHLSEEYQALGKPSRSDRRCKLIRSTQ